MGEFDAISRQAQLVYIDDLITYLHMFIHRTTGLQRLPILIKPKSPNRSKQILDAFCKSVTHNHIKYTLLT